MIRTMIGFLILAAVAAALPLGAVAQEPDREEGVKKAAEFLAGLEGTDDALLGTYWYGVYMKMAKNVGKGKIVVERAPEGTGIYKAVADMTFVGTRIKAEEICDGKLGLVSSTSSETDDGNEKKEVQRLEAGAWTCTKTETDASGTYKAEPSAPHHGEMFSTWALARKLPLTPARYVFQAISWPDPTPAFEEDGFGEDEGGEDEGEEEEEKGSYMDLIVTVGEAAELDIRGKKIQAHPIRFKKDEEGGDTWVFHVTAEHTVVAFAPDETPMLFVLGTEEEAAQDLGPLPAETDDQKAVKAAVMVFFKVMAKEADVDALDDVVDWSSVRKALAEKQPMFEQMSDEDAAAMLKGFLQAGESPISKDKLTFVELALEATVDGDTAKVTVPGTGDKPMVLKKVDGKWKMVEFGG